MTGIAIKGMGVALPGENGIKGTPLDGKSILGIMLGGKKNFIRKKTLTRMERLISLVEARSGIKIRNILNDDSVKYPSSYLAFEAAKKTLENTGISPSNIQGMICATDTADFVYPRLTGVVARLLGIKMIRQSLNVPMACTSISSALQSAANWLDKGLCDNVLVLAGDVTSRLRLPQNRIEPYIFGDGFVGIYLEKGKESDKGGFKFSNVSEDISIADAFVHRRIYASQLGYLNSELQENYQDNDTGLDILGEIDALELSYLFQDYLTNSGESVDENMKIILPQLGKLLVEKGIRNFKQDTGIDVKPRVVSNSAFNHGNLGAGAIPLAWYEGIKSGEIKSDNSVIFDIAGVGGVKTVFKWDPKVSDSISFVKIASMVKRPDYEKMVKDVLAESVRKAKDKGYKTPSLNKLTARDGVIKFESINPPRREMGNIEDIIQNLRL
ncbi:MAG: hypothetical protein HY094_07220 [Candidatus Melainabacteria bacterium]|nr:hypothetical protein [Candidatus Melainabacteria bacterium]